MNHPHRTIGGKLNRLVLLSVGVALLVVCSLSLWRDATTFVASKRALLIATANVFSSASSKAVADGDTFAATHALRAIARVPDLIYAEVRDRNSRVLTDMGRGARLTRDPALSEHDDVSLLSVLSTQTLTISVPVLDGGSKIGELELVGDTSGLPTQLAWSLLHAIAGFILASSIGLALALRLRRSITGPIEKLTKAMYIVGQSNDYTGSVAVCSDDETGQLAKHFNVMISEIRASTDRILAREKEIIERLAKAGEMRDDQTGQHVNRVAEVSRMIATQLGLPNQFVEDLHRASPLHDVGKISISDAILHKPGRLNVEERCEMEQHALRGFQLLSGSQSTLVQMAAEIAISHHERWDGEGYPNRIAGTDIPQAGRITAVADVCDALLSKRPYKEPWSFDEVRKLLKKEAGSHFDPACVEALLVRWPSLQDLYRSSTSSTSVASAV